MDDDQAIAVGVALPHRIFCWMALVFGVGFSMLALLTRRWAIAWIALSRATVGSAIGMLAVWSRQTAMTGHPGPGIGLILAWITMILLAFHWGRVVWTWTAVQMAAEAQRRRDAARRDTSLLDGLAPIEPGIASRGAEPQSRPISRPPVEQPALLGRYASSRRPAPPRLPLPPLCGALRPQLPRFPPGARITRRGTGTAQRGPGRGRYGWRRRRRDLLLHRPSQRSADVSRGALPIASHFSAMARSAAWAALRLDGRFARPRPVTLLGLGVGLELGVAFGVDGVAGGEKSVLGGLEPLPERVVGVSLAAQPADFPRSAGRGRCWRWRPSLSDNASARTQSSLLGLPRPAFGVQLGNALRGGG